MGTFRKSLLYSMVLALGAPLTGCSLSADTWAPESNNKIMISKARSEEIVPASQQGVVTAKGYRVQSSMSFHSNPTNFVTPQGYKVSTSVQSTLYED